MNITIKAVYVSLLSHCGYVWRLENLIGKYEEYFNFIRKFGSKSLIRQKVPPGQDG